MKLFLKAILCFSLLMVAVFSFGLVEPVSATNYVVNFAQEHVEFAPLLAGAPLLATIVKEQCSIAQSELDALKAKYGKIKIISVVIEPPVYETDGTVTDKGEVYYFAVRRPDTSHVRLLMDYVKKSDLDGYVNAFIKNLVVAGDTQALKDDGLVYLGFQTKIDEFLKPYQSFLANA